jgi:hypothetical protein
MWLSVINFSYTPQVGWLSILLKTDINLHHLFGWDLCGYAFQTGRPERGMKNSITALKVQ